MDPLSPVIEALHGEGRLRVWSLVITVFGDAVQPRGGRVAAASLQRLLERLGVGSGALRTAVSRLARDGWIVRERDGRTASYRLSARGIGEFGPATRLIYAPPATRRPEWTLGLGPPPPRSVRVGSEAWLAVTPESPVGPLAVAGRIAAMSDDMKRTLLSDQHRAALSALATDLGTLEGRNLGPLDAMAARTALIHRWRRIALRFPDLPDDMLPASLQSVRSRVAALYGALLPMSETWLDDPSGGDLPAASTDLWQRFRRDDDAIR